MLFSVRSLAVYGEIVGGAFDKILCCTAEVAMLKIDEEVLDRVLRARLLPSACFSERVRLACSGRACEYT